MTATHADRIRAQLATEKCPAWQSAEDFAAYQQTYRDMLAAYDAADFAAADAADHARMARLRGAC